MEGTCPTCARWRGVPHLNYGAQPFNELVDVGLVEEFAERLAQPRVIGLVLLNEYVVSLDPL